jgi:hypothetical protein
LAWLILTQKEIVMTHKLAKLIAAFEVIGGIIGVVMGIWPFFRIGESQGPTGTVVAYYAICAGFTLLYFLSLYAGIKLWQDKRLGYKLSFIVQAVQVPLLSSTLVIYNFVSGISLAAIFGQFGPSVKFLIGNSFSLGFDRPDAPFAIGINCLALVILVYLVYHYKKVRR